MATVAYNLLSSIPTTNPVESVVDYLEIVELADITTPIVKNWIPIFGLPTVGISAKHLVWMNGTWEAIR